MNSKKRARASADNRHGLDVQIGSNPKIAILKPGGLGDFLAITPALRALRKAYPQAKITLITRSDLVPFCERHPRIDRVIACPSYPGVTGGMPDEQRLREFFAAFAAESLDLALQWAGNGTSSNQLVRRLGARLTVGFHVPGAADLDLPLPFDDHRHEVLRFLDCLAALGIPDDGLHMEVQLLPEDFAELRRVVPQLAGEEGRYLGVNPTSADPKRRWPADRFAAVVDALRQDYAFDAVFLVGGGDQRDQTRAVIDHLRRRDRVIDLAGVLGLGGLAALFSRLDLLITTDSGPAHLAATVGAPSVIVFGAGPPARWAPTSWLWHRPLADWQSPCRSFVPGCCDDLPVARCLDRITVEQVLFEARHLIRLASAAPPQRTSTGTQIAHPHKDSSSRGKIREHQGGNR